MEKMENVEYDQLPHKMKKKIEKRYRKLEKKHPGITELEIKEKIERKMKIKFEFE